MGKKLLINNGAFLASTAGFWLADDAEDCCDCVYIPPWPPCRTQGARPPLFAGTETTQTVGEDIRVGGVSVRYLNGVVETGPLRYERVFQLAYLLNPVVRINYTFTPDFVSQVLSPFVQRTISCIVSLKTNEGTIATLTSIGGSLSRQVLNTTTTDVGASRFTGELIADFAGGWSGNPLIPNSGGTIEWENQSVIIAGGGSYSNTTDTLSNRSCTEEVIMEVGIGINFSEGPPFPGIGDHELRGTLDVSLEVFYP